MGQFGKVYLVGAGPGDPDLLTVKAERLIRTAEAVVFDRLVSDAILDLIPRGAMRINVGKQPASHPVPQDQINEILVRLARSGRRVVRLKGGDPFTFGRGSEEAEHLARCGIAFEVVPGITSASACTAAIGVPLTHRGLATGVRYVTGHCRADADLDLDWAGLADANTTLVVYMGFAQIGTIACNLIAAGMPASTPAAAIANGTLPTQRHVVGTIATIADLARDFAGSGPVLFIIGQVVTLAAILGGTRDATTGSVTMLQAHHA